MILIGSLLIAFQSLSLAVGEVRPLPPRSHLLRIFPPDLLTVEGDSVRATRGGRGVVILRTPRGRRIVRVEVHPYRAWRFHTLPSRWELSVGESRVLIPPGDYTLQAMGLPENRIQVDMQEGGLVARCSRTGRGVVFYEIRQDDRVQFGRGVVVCLPPWDPSELVLYLRTGEEETLTPRWWDRIPQPEVWARGGIAVQATPEGIRVQGLTEGRGTLLIAAGKRRIPVPVYVDIPPLFPPRVATLPLKRIELPPDVDSIVVYPPRALDVKPDGTIEIHRPVRRALVEVWKDGRVGTVILLGHPAPDGRWFPREPENPWRRPRAPRPR